MKKKSIIQFICYNPRIYSGFDNFQVKLTKKLDDQNIQNILVYSDALNLQKLRDDITAAGGIIEIISARNKFTISRDVLRLYLKYKPYVVHVHFVNYIYLLTAVLSVAFRSDYYFSFWSEISSQSVYEYKRSKSLMKLLMLRIFYRFLIMVSKKALLGSEALKKQLKTFSGSASEKITTYYLGTEIYTNKKDKNELKKCLEVPTDFKVISNISAIEEKKGIHILIEALKLLKQKYNIHNFICYHVGTIRAVTSDKIEYYNLLRDRINAFELEPNFVWLEFLDDVTDVLKVSDIYVHPSLQEGLGSGNLEAATQSLPIIGSNVGGIPEIVNHGTNGYLFSNESVDELALFLSLLIGDENLRINMGKQSLKIVSEKFNVDKQIDDLLIVYAEKK